MIGVLRKYDGWAISIGNFDQGHLLLFADRVMVTGPIGSLTIAEITTDEDLKQRMKTKDAE